MLKYTTTQIVFSEIPDEITLAIELSNCHIHCPACHSKYLWNDVGTELDINTLDRLISDYKGITCLCFMGDGGDSKEIFRLGVYIKNEYPDLKIALYSGYNELEQKFWEYFDYLKLGPYIEELGPLNNQNTNQRLYKKENNVWVDITYKFWK